MVTRPTKKKRLRRAPDEARTLILEGAERVFSTHLPDEVGLKDVARAAGISHALVTYYFGTYDALVDAVVERRFLALREGVLRGVMRVVSEGGDGLAILAEHRKALAEMASDPLAVRLSVYALLSGRVDAEDFLPARIQGLKMLAEVLEMRSGAPRDDVEVALFASLAMTVGWTIAKNTVLRALGRRPSREVDEAFERGIDEMLAQFLLRGAKPGRPAKARR